MRPLVPLLWLLLGCPGETADTDVDPVDADEDGYSEEVDCDDGDAAVHPYATETCNQTDDDCDGQVDEGAIDATTWHRDGDGDGFGDPLEVLASCTLPEGFTADSTDCDDRDPRFYPGAAEDDCTDPNDYDCDGLVVWADADADGWAACLDCDDEDATISPSGIEVCDGDDNDCDELVDEPDALDASWWYRDGDGDGFGDPAVSELACDAPEGYVADSTDCDDLSDGAYPGAIEVCNGNDDDCDGENDEDSVGAGTYYLDSDGDGYGTERVSVLSCTPVAGFALDSGDCDDFDPDSYPEGNEVCDGRDNDCDDDIDEDAIDPRTFYADFDGDGFGDLETSTAACEAPDGYVADATDCDDTDVAAHPGGVELCGGADSDCDGDPDLGAVDAPTWYRDGDRDGFGDPLDSRRDCSQPRRHVVDGSDCDDDDDEVYPGATELCSTTGDDDCDGVANDGEAADASTWYADADGDGHGDLRYPVDACEAPEGHVDTSDDCDDLDPDALPGGDEVCDGVDNDCDGLVDDADEVSGRSTWYPDADEDGYGGDGDSVLACVGPSGWVDLGGDCDDDDPSARPGAVEVCDEVDNDCSGSADDGAVDAPTWYRDADGDGHGASSTTVTACEQPTSPLYVALGDDCLDVGAAADATYPGATEVCDEVDNDCDGETDEDAVDAGVWYIDRDADGQGAAAFPLPACEQPVGYVGNADDCDDLSAWIYDGAVEVCDGMDNNCDEVIDDDAVDLVTVYYDADGDGYGDPTVFVEGCALDGWVDNDGDCDDSDFTVAPGRPQGCDGGDHDCDGDIDNDDDGDGFWDKACGGEDCDDDDAMVNPASTEVCDGIDNDCDGTVDNDEHVLGDDPECYAYSCKDIDDARSGLDDGSYYIDPTDSGSPFEVHCDMHTDGGGYTFLKVDYGSTAYAVDAESHCDGYGMQLFIPRTNNHLVAAYDIAYDASIGPSAANYLYIMGIYPNYYRATCTNRALKSGSSGCNWSASDGRAFWVTNRTNISEPNGDNGTTSSMYYSFHSDGSIDWYNDIPYPGYGSRYFMCDVGDKY